MRGIENLKYNSEKESFRFGHSKVYESRENVEIPIKVGSKERKINVSIVQANVPLLFGKDYLQGWACQQDFSHATLKFGNTGETIKMEETPSGHYAINLIEEQKVITHEINDSMIIAHQKMKSMKH